MARKDHSMSNLKKNESPEGGVRRLLLDLIDDARAELREFDTPEENVHEARKDFKKARALLRMVRKDLGEDSFKPANIAFRDAGRELSLLRDSWVLHATVLGLADRYGNLLAEGVFDTILNRLNLRYERLLKEFCDSRRVRERLLATLDEWEEPIRSLPVSATDFKAFHGGIRKVYKRGRNAADRARTATDTEALHEWRKRVKYLYYQLGYLEKLWPEELSAYAGGLNELADLLGQDHDLAVLGDTLNTIPGLYKDPMRFRLLLGLAAQERERLQDQLWPLAQRLYRENPDAFANRLHGYWVAMRMEG